MIVEDDWMILQIFQMGDGATSEEVPMDVMTLDVMTHQQAARAEREAEVQAT